MKTIKLLSVLCEAISMCTAAIELVGENHEGQEPYNVHGSEHFIMSGSMTVVRDLCKELPDRILDGEIETKLGNFYLHLFRDDDDNLKMHDLSMAANVIHSSLHDKYFAGQEAIELYT